MHIPVGTLCVPSDTIFKRDTDFWAIFLTMLPLCQAHYFNFWAHCGRSSIISIVVKLHLLLTEYEWILLNGSILELQLSELGTRSSEFTNILIISIFVALLVDFQSWVWFPSNTFCNKQIKICKTSSLVPTLWCVVHTLKASRWSKSKD